MKFNLNLDSINYIKIVYKDTNDKVCCTKAAIKQMGEREIFACARFEDGLFISTPQEVLLSFICDNGLYRTSTHLKYISKEEPYIFFALQTPNGLEYQQNREYFRVKKDDKVILKFDDKIITCKMHDISANGVRLIIPENIGEPKNVTIDMLFSGKSIKTAAKFIRTDNEDGILKSSFSFINMSQADQDSISQICIQTQLEYKRNTLK